MSEGKKAIKRAAAISYDPAENAVPVLTAFGEGFLAEKIIARAEESNVPVVFDEGLAGMFAKMNIGDEIPPELYAAVAQILVFLSNTDHKYGERLKSGLNRHK